MECKGAYTDDEFTAISKKLTSERNRRYSDKNRETINENQNQYDKEHREEKRQWGNPSAGQFGGRSRFRTGLLLQADLSAWYYRPVERPI